MKKAVFLLAMSIFPSWVYAGVTESHREMCKTVASAVNMTMSVLGTGVVITCEGASEADGLVGFVFLMRDAGDHPTDRDALLFLSSLAGAADGISYGAPDMYVLLIGGSIYGVTHSDLKSCSALPTDVAVGQCVSSLITLVK